MVSHSGLLHLGVAGVCRKPAKRRRGTRYFCDVFLQRLRTNPPARGGSTKSWNAGGVATSPEGRCAGSCSLEGLEGVSAPPQGPHHRACRRPGRSPRPDRKELHSRCSSSGNWWATITYIHTREGFVYPATVTGLLLEKNCWLRHGGTHANRIGPKRSAKLTARNCQPIKGVTIFHVESRDRSTRPLTTPPP